MFKFAQIKSIFWKTPRGMLNIRQKPHFSADHSFELSKLQAPRAGRMLTCRSKNLLYRRYMTSVDPLDQVTLIMYTCKEQRKKSEGWPNNLHHNQTGTLWVSNYASTYGCSIQSQMLRSQNWSVLHQTPAPAWVLGLKLKLPEQLPQLSANQGSSWDHLKSLQQYYKIGRINLSSTTAT